MKNEDVIKRAAYLAIAYNIVTNLRDDGVFVIKNALSDNEVITTRETLQKMINGIVRQGLDV